jgi:CMP-N,N'-diacetyllegionaminic acid synthase
MKLSKNTAIIPARAGSKRIKKKNSKLLCGQPLVEWTIQQAYQSQLFGKIILSTDDEFLIQNYAGDSRLIVHKRNPSSSSDEAPMSKVITDVISSYNLTGFVCLLQPTSPLRRASDIVDSYGLLRSISVDSVVSVRRARHPCEWSFPKSNFLTEAFVNGMDGKQSQNLNYQYELNGAIYWYCVDKYLIEKRQLMVGAAIFEMPYWCSIDIDDITDFMLCELILSTDNNILSGCQA